jgi:hypothetical protein
VLCVMRAILFCAWTRIFERLTMHVPSHSAVVFQFLTSNWSSPGSCM